MVVADIPVGKACRKNPAQLRIAVTKAERAAVQVQIKKFPAVNIPIAIAFTTAGDEVDPAFQQTIDSARVKVVTGLLENLGLCKSGGQLLRPWQKYRVSVS